MNKINILLVDDHKIFREGLSSILSKEKDISIIAETSNGPEAIKLAKELPVDVIIMDIDMGQTNGIETTKSIKETNPHANILILSMIGLHDFILQALEAGAIGYLLKNTGKDELVNAIRCAAKGDSYFSREISNILISHINKPNIPSKNQLEIPLSPREIEVLKLIAQEYSNSEIATKLFISIRTVDTHRRNLLEKLNIKNNVGLTKYALKKGIID